MRVIFHMRTVLPLYLLAVHGIMGLQNAKAGKQSLHRGKYGNPETDETQRETPGSKSGIYIESEQKYHNEDYLCV